MKRILTLVMVMVAAIVATAGSASSTDRSGALHVTKECSHYAGAAGDWCTITSSNINAIRPGMRVIYSSPIDLTHRTLNSDLTIDGPGHNAAFGHVVLDASTFTCVVTLSGGTGRFSNLHAQVLVACPAFPVCSWDGTYNFTP